jgi:O-antigen/teichoic acid export membrane protein
LGAAAGLALLAGGPVWLLARPLLTLVFTGGSAVDYGQAASTLRILVAGLPFIFVIWMLQAVATAVFLERLLLKTAAIGALLNVALNLFLIPRYGRDGAAFATLVGEALTMTLLFWGLRSVLRGSTTDRGRMIQYLRSRNLRSSSGSRARAVSQVHNTGGAMKIVPASVRSRRTVLCAA